MGSPPPPKFHTDKNFKKIIFRCRQRVWANFGRSIFPLAPIGIFCRRQRVWAPRSCFFRPRGRCLSIQCPFSALRKGRAPTYFYRV